MAAHLRRGRNEPQAREVSVAEERHDRRLRHDVRTGVGGTVGRVSIYGLDVEHHTEAFAG